MLSRCDASAAKGCSNPPPGVAKMVRGVDVTELDLDPIGYTGSSGFLYPVVKFTCDQGKIWKSPEGKDYQLPDQVWRMTTVPGGWLGADVRIYKTSNEVRKSMANRVGVEGQFGKFGFSVSTSFSKMQNSITNTSKFISDVTAFQSASRVDFLPSWNGLFLDVSAQKFVDESITGTYETSPGPYRKFIEHFGTHYFGTGNFGGYIRVVHETSSNYALSSSQHKLEVNAKASYLNVISVNGGHVSGSTTVDTAFQEQTSKTIRYYGGNTNLLSQSGIQAWQPTVNSNPTLFSGELKPISDLISDSTKKASMIQAVNDHVLKKYLDELVRLLYTARSKSTNVVALDGLEKRIQTLKAKIMLTEDEVETLAADIDKFVTECYEMIEGKVVYRGSVSRTVKGIKCQNWRSQTPHKPASDLPDLPGNTCRDPDGSGRPWCYTNDPHTRWDYCPVLPCKVDTCYVIMWNSVKRGHRFVYHGTKSTTKGGYTCQNWNSQSPHVHHFQNYGLDKNICNDPYQNGGELWCFTTSPSKKYDYCSIFPCKGWPNVK